VQRRDLTGAQKAIAAAKRWGLEEKKKGRPQRNGENVPDKDISVRDLAKQFRIGKESIKQAYDLLNEAPDLVAEVEARKLSLALATEKLQQKRKDAARAKKYAKQLAEYNEAILGGAAIPRARARIACVARSRQR
jgi:hypothetical protein